MFVDDFEKSLFFSPDDDGGEATERPMGVFEDDDEEEIVIVDSEDDIPIEETDEDDLPEEVKSKSKKDLYSQLISQKNSNESMAETLKEGFTSLSQTLKPAAIVEKPVEVDMDAARKNFEKAIFEQDPAGATEKFIKLVSKPMEDKLAENEMKTFNVAVDIYKNDDKYKEIFENDEAEIVSVLGTYDPKFQRDPRVLKQVIDGIKQRKLIENPLSDVDLKEKLKAEIMQELIADGKIPDPSKSSKATYTASSRRTTPNAGGKKKVYYTQAQMDGAARQGVKIEHYVRNMGGKR